jgi:hypothetical protein
VSNDQEIITENDTIDAAYRMMLLRDFKDETGEQSMKDYLEKEYGIPYDRMEQFYQDMAYGEGDRYKISHEVAFSIALIFLKLGVNFANMTNDLNLDFLNE